MQTKHEIRVTFRDVHELAIPPGTKAHWIDGGTGGWSVYPDQVELLSDTDSLFMFDKTHFFIWVDEKDLEMEY